MFLSNENGMSENFLSCIEGFKYCFEFTRERGISLETLQRERASSCNDGGTSWFFSSYDGELREPLDLAQGSPISIQVTVGAGDYSRVTAGQIDLI